MSPAAIEHGISSVFDRLDQGSAARSRKLEFAKNLRFHQELSPIITISPQAISRNGDSRWFKNGLLVAEAGLLAVACTFGTPAKAEVRPTATAVGIGAELVKTGNAEVDEIGQKLADPQTRGGVPESDILKWNEAQTAKADATATAEAQKPTPTPEVKAEPYDNGILSPKAYTKAEYITWGIPGGGKGEGIGIALEAGEEFRIPENLQVATTERTIGGNPAGYRITALRRNGSGFSIYGDVIPSTGIDNFGKDLPAGTTVGTGGGTGITVLDDNYTVFMTFRDEIDLQKFFPDQTKSPPKFIINKFTLNPPPTQSPKPGAIFFDITPPTQR